MTISNDRKNLEAFVNGDRRGAEAVISLYATPLINHCSHMLGGNIGRAEEIVQECFLKLWKNAAKLIEGDKVLYLRAWLFRVATNAVLDDKRKPQSVGDSPLAELESGEQSVLDGIIKNERAALAMLLVNALPQRQRAAILMSHFEGMGNEEIGRALDVSVEAVESLLSRARRSLRERALSNKEGV